MKQTTINNFSLSKQQMDEIRQKFDHTWRTTIRLAEEYLVSTATIQRIVYRMHKTDYRLL